MFLPNAARLLARGTLLRAALCVVRACTMKASVSGTMLQQLTPCSCSTGKHVICNSARRHTITMADALEV